MMLTGFKDLPSQLAPLFKAGFFARHELEKNAAVTLVGETVVMAAEQYYVRYAFRERLAPGAAMLQVLAEYAHRRRDVNHSNRP